MGTWISHLRIAEQLLTAMPQLDEVAFIYGNLAPDSGLPNADWSAFDPPKEVTHFLRPGEDEGRIAGIWLIWTPPAIYNSTVSRWATSCTCCVTTCGRSGS